MFYHNLHNFTEKPSSLLPFSKFTAISKTLRTIPIFPSRTLLSVSRIIEQRYTTKDDFAFKKRVTGRFDRDLARFERRKGVENEGAREERRKRRTRQRQSERERKREMRCRERRAESGGALPLLHFQGWKVQDNGAPPEGWHDRKPQDISIVSSVKSWNETGRTGDAGQKGLRFVKKKKVSRLCFSPSLEWFLASLRLSIFWSQLHR